MQENLKNQYSKNQCDLRNNQFDEDSKRESKTQKTKQRPASVHHNRTIQPGPSKQPDI